MQRTLTVLLAGSVTTLALAVFAEERTPARVVVRKVEAEKSTRAAESETTAAVQVRQVATPRVPARAALLDRGTTEPESEVVRVLLAVVPEPVVIELRVTVDGVAFRTARHQLIRDWMVATDTDKNGHTTWDELVANPRALLSSLQGRPADFVRSLQNTIDVPRDGIVSYAEFEQLLQQTLGLSPDPIQFQFQPDPNRTDLITHLDKDGNGRLSRDEWSLAPERLRSRDLNDDELVDVSEVGGVRNMVPNYAAAAATGRGAMPAARNVTRTVVLNRHTSLASVHQALQRVYAGPHAPVLPIEEAGLKWAAELDTNRNGRLDVGECIAFFSRTPQVVLAVDLGKTESLKVVRSADASPTEPGTGAVREGKLFAMSLPRERVLVSASVGQTYAYNSKATAQQYLRAYDRDNNAYLDAEDLKSPQGQYLKTMFEAWDENGDGKVFAEEIERSLDRQYRPTLTTITLYAGETEPSLFKLLDRNADGRIGSREMAEAAQRLRAFDKNDDGVISAEELQGELRLEVSRGFGRGMYSAQALNAAGGGVSSNTPTAKGPVPWFTHMDRNGDGDVTPREFLGTAEQFRAIDTNGDGFIELSEAQAAGSLSLPASIKPAVGQP